MVKVGDAQIAARYQLRETQTALKTHYKGCYFCKLPIQKNESYKPGNGYQGNACLPCVNKLSPPPVPKAVPPSVPQIPIDCSPSADWAKLLDQAQETTSAALRSLDEARKENAILQKEKDRLVESLKFFEILVDNAMKLIAQERKFTSTAFMAERLNIKRTLIMMNRWTDE